MQHDADTRLHSLDGQVDVWAVDLDALDPCEIEAHRGMLDAVERARLDRYRSDKARSQFLAGRALLRRTLSRYTQVDPCGWAFHMNAWGRPFVAAPADGAHLFFSLSHTEGLVALAISRRPEIGIDVESTARALPSDFLKHLLLSPDEERLIDASTDRTPREAFIAHWCLKEALLKARGTGLSERLDAFGFDLGGAEPVLRCAADIDTSPESWLLRFLDISPSHTVALAARKHDAVRIFDCEAFP